MKKIVTQLEKIIVFCKDIQKMTSVYSQVLGLKVFLQGNQLVQLRDSNNIKIILKKTNQIRYLGRGYSPMMSFKVENFEQTYSKLTNFYKMESQGVVECQRGKMSTIMGLQGQILCIHNLKNLQEQQLEQQNNERDKVNNLSQKQIENILSKIKL